MFSNPPGIAVSIFRGNVGLLGVEGSQYGCRVGYWPVSWFSMGGEVCTAFRLYRHGLGGESSTNFMRFHTFVTFHGRFFPVIHPYIRGSIGRNFINEDANNQWSSTSNGVESGITVIVGLAAEFGKYQVGIEAGGGSMGSGHDEVNLIVSYAMGIPSYKPLSNFSVRGGLQYFFPFSGPYESDTGDGGYDIIVTPESTDSRTEYNLGIFMTKGPHFDTGVVNFGAGWKILKNY